MKTFSIFFRLFNFFSFCLYVSSASSYQPRVTVDAGALVGTFGTSLSGKTYFQFLGIPFAKPPIEDRRFKEPERLHHWIGEWNATTPGSYCLQIDHFTKYLNEDGQYVYGVIGDEDCLYLNVYTRNLNSKSKHVLVMIHGGGFTFGAAHTYEPEYLMDDEDLVYVSMNYRLGPLGFLSTGDSVIPGNNGLKDQVAALEWIQRNIAAFGGDPNKVSLIGLSAGGASVHYLILSPLSAGLFNKGFSLSGTALCPWALDENPVQKTKQLSALLGCPTTDSRAMYKCLKRRPAQKIVESLRNFQEFLYNPFTIFGPVVEFNSSRPFISKSPEEILKNGEQNDVPWVSGFTSEDGLYPAAEFIENDRYLQQLDEKWADVAPSLIYYLEEPKKTIAIKIKEVYLGKEKFSKATVPQLLQMLSDRLFISPAARGAILNAKRNTQPVYLYKYSYRNVRSISQTFTNTKSIYGACHADDMSLVVNLSGFHGRETEEDKKMAEIFKDVLLTFSRTGAPPKSLNWEPVSPEAIDTVKYLLFKNPKEIKMVEEKDVGKTKIWDKVLGKSSTPHEEL